MNDEYRILIDYCTTWSCYYLLKSPMYAKPEACTGHWVANEFAKAHRCLQLRYINRSPEYFLYPSIQANLSQPPTRMSQITSTHFPLTSRNRAHTTPCTQPSRTQHRRLLAFEIPQHKSTHLHPETCWAQQTSSERQKNQANRFLWKRLTPHADRAGLTLY